MKFSIEALYTWYRDVIRNPKYRWWVVGASLLYLVSPIDISPDIFPVIGWIDDGIIATLLVTELSQIVLERLKGSKGGAPSAAQPNPDVAQATSDDTVDVNAVSVH